MPSVAATYTSRSRFPAKPPRLNFVLSQMGAAPSCTLIRRWEQITQIFADLVDVAEPFPPKL